MQLFLLDLSPVEKKKEKGENSFVAYLPSRREAEGKRKDSSPSLGKRKIVTPLPVAN